jgi:hypothetical protein
MLINKQELSKQSLLHGLLLAIIFLLLSSTVQADDLNKNNPFAGVPEVVSNSEMAEMRGRFIRQGRPIYFGISMQSQWSSAAGTSINVGMNIGINLRKDIATDNRITIGVQMDDLSESSEGEVPAAAVSPSSDVNIGGLDSAQGVVQAITVVGDDNRAHNRTYMTMQMVSPDQAESGSRIYYFGGQNLSAGKTATEITSTASRTNESGVVTTAFVDEAGVGIKIEVPEQGTAMQFLRGKSDGSEGSGFFQTIQIEGSNSNSVTNQLNFIAEFSPADGNANVISIQPALDSLKLIQGIGIQ